MKVKQILALLLGWMLLVGLCPVAALADAPENTAHAGYIVKLRDDAPVPYAGRGGIKPLGFGLYYVAYPADAVTLSDIGAVEYVEPNLRVRLLGAVDEPDYKKGKQWYLNGEHGLQTEHAWAEGLDGSGVTVAVLDTGLFDHADFKNTHILKERGYNATGDGGDYGDVTWHGTAVTGVIAAGVNDYGIVGAAYGTDILPVRVFDSNGEGYISYLLDALHYAVEQQVDVINLSLSVDKPLKSMYDAVLEAVDAGIILVAAAGNDGNAVLNYPAAFPGVIGVGAINRDGTVAGFSQKNESVWVAAPGAEITTTDSKQNGYTTTKGTSFSAPCVSALAAVAKQYARAAGQSLDPEEFAQLLRLSALDAGDPDYDCCYGFGIVNAPRLLETLQARQVRYALNGGAWMEAAPETGYLPYGIDAVELTRTEPVKEGCFFGGWYDNEDCDGAPVDSFVPAAGAIERTYYARWVEDVTAPAAVTLNGRTAEPGETGRTWTVYYPVGTALPEGGSAVAEVSFAYTGNAYSLEYRTDWDEAHGCWNIRVTQRAGEERYQAVYHLVADNSSYHAPTLTEQGSGGILGEATPASLDGKTPARPFVAAVADWFTNETADETLQYALEGDTVAGLELSDGLLRYTPPAAAAGTQVRFGVTAENRRFSGPPAYVTVSVGELPLSAPVLAETGGSYDALSPAALQLAFIPYDNTLRALRAGGAALLEGRDYTVDVETDAVTLQPEYLKTLPNGNTTVLLCFGTERLSGNAVEQTAEYTVRVVNSCVGGHNWQGDVCLNCGEKLYIPATTVGPAEPETAERTEILEKADGFHVTTLTDRKGNVHISAIGIDGRTVAELSLPASPDGTTTFDDVADDAWYAQEVGQAAAYGLFHGTAERRFSPETVMTRGMFFATLYRLSGAPAYGADKAAFADVAATAWYALAANWSYAVGLTRGTGAATFSAEQDLSREQLVTVLFRYARLLGADSGKRGAIDSFPDGSSISAWAAEAMEWALAEGLILGRASGTGPHIAAGETVTRAETAVILCRFITYLRNK